MGFMRKALFLGTGGLSGMAGVRANSKKERTAKATERLASQATRSTTPTRSGAGRRWDVVCPECRETFSAPKSQNVGCPRCGTRVSVSRVGTSVLAKRIGAPRLDGRGRIISQD
jgi:ssDNA-binding Zn-finger/Zn-ribbon topoisomerase 1